ncbi:unnamed protein product, partial [Staurois parvus]
MALGMKGLTSGAIKGLNVCCVLLYLSMLLCIALHSRAIQSNVLELTGERS